MPINEEHIEDRIDAAENANCSVELLDKKANPCSKASLLEDGSLLLKCRMTVQGYFLDDGTFVHKNGFRKKA
jgi:hypothetical protein